MTKSNIFIKLSVLLQIQMALLSNFNLLIVISIMSTKTQTTRLLLALFILLMGTVASAQSRPSGQRNNTKHGEKKPQAIGQIYGKVIDSISGHPLEYTTVALYRKRSNELETGTISHANGNFFLENVKPGRYYLKVSFMGYNDKILSDLSIGRDHQIINLHKIAISSSMENLDEVVIDGSAPRIDYQIDKK